MFPDFLKFFDWISQSPRFLCTIYKKICMFCTWTKYIFPSIGLVFCDPNIKRSWRNRQEGKKKSSLGCCWPSCCWLWGVFKPGYTHRLPTVYTVLIKHKPLWDIPTHFHVHLFFLPSSTFHCQRPGLVCAEFYDFILYFLSLFTYFHIMPLLTHVMQWWGLTRQPPSYWLFTRGTFSPPVCDQSLWLYLTLQGGVVASSCVSAWVVAAAAVGVLRSTVASHYLQFV